MPRVCQITGKGTTSGQNRSHSKRATKRTFKPNLIQKWVTLDDGSKIKLKISSRLYKKVRGLI